MYGKSDYILKKVPDASVYVTLTVLFIARATFLPTFNHFFSCYSTTVITFLPVGLVIKILKVQRNQEHITLQNRLWKHALLEKFLQIFL